MTEPCPNCGKDHGPTIHINRPRFVKFHTRVRRARMRRYEIVYSGRSRRKAFRELAEAMGADINLKRGDVLGDEGPESYYEPAVLVEMKR